MKCPRCGTENPVPEAHEHSCYNCGFPLTGEVARQDVQAAARRRFYLQLGALLVILAGFAAFAWTRNWFGLAGQSAFTPSERPEVTQLIGGGSVTVTSNGSSYLLARDAAWQVTGVVFASRQYDDDRLAPVAPVDILLVWGDAASIKRERLELNLQDRSATIKANDLTVDLPSLVKSTAVLHLSSDPRTLRALLGLRPGSKVTLGGFVVSTIIEGERIAGTKIPGRGERPNAYLLYITDLAVNGKVVVPAS